MVTCLKHKVSFNHGKCPVCDSKRKGVSVKYSSSNPEHRSDYIQDSINKLNMLTLKLKKLNESLTKLLKDNK